MDVEDNHSSQKSHGSSFRVELMEAESQGSGKQDLFQQQLALSPTAKIGQQSTNNILNHQNLNHYSSKKMEMRKILSSSSSNEQLPCSLKNDSSSIQHSIRAKKEFEHENSLDQGAFLSCLKKRHDKSFSIENNVRDQSSSKSSDAKSHRNFSILPSSFKEEEGYSTKRVGCNCRKSKCLKLYCQCFQKKLFCNEDCNCVDCGNHSQNTTHKNAIIGALTRNGRCFQEDKLRDYQRQQQGGFELELPMQQMKKACKCTKTHCLKGYCQCLQNGSYCGIFCKCEFCLNRPPVQNFMDEEVQFVPFIKRQEEGFSIASNAGNRSSLVLEFNNQVDWRSNLPSLASKQDQSASKRVGCNCRKSKCLKLYCECFQKQLFCNDSCNCYNCGNCPGNVAHKQAIIEALTRNDRCFDQEKPKVAQKEQLSGFKLEIPLQQFKRGCKCTKTHCLKSYCQCLQNGGYCGIFCKCLDCRNKPVSQKK